MEDSPNRPRGTGWRRVALAAAIAGAAAAATALVNQVVELLRHLFAS